MSEAQLSVVSRLIVEFEDNVKKAKHATSDDAKRLILRAQAISEQLKLVAESVIAESEKTINSEKEALIDSIRKKFNEERENEISQIRRKAESNLDLAAAEVLRALEGAYK